MSEKKWIIYCITNTENNKKYVGQTTKTLQERWKGHIAESNNKSVQGYVTVFKRAIRKYGIDKFKLEILEENIETAEDANEKEIMYIREHKTHVNYGGYNMTVGGAPAEEAQCEWIDHKVYKFELKYLKTKYHEGKYCFHCRGLALACARAIDRDDEIEEEYKDHPFKVSKMNNAFAQGLIESTDMLLGNERIRKAYLAQCERQKETD